MARTPLMGRVQHAVSVVAEATERKVPVEQVLEERTTRREPRHEPRAMLRMPESSVRIKPSQRLEIATALMPRARRWTRSNSG